MNQHQLIASRAADLIDARHWAANSLRAAFSYAAGGAGRYPQPVAGGYPDYEAIIAFERHWIGEREHLSDGSLASETATDRAERVGDGETLAALRAFAAGKSGLARDFDPLETLERVADLVRATPIRSPRAMHQ